MDRQRDLSQRQSSFWSTKTKLFSNGNGIGKHSIGDGTTKPDVTLPSYSTSSSPRNNTNGGDNNHCANGKTTSNGSHQRQRRWSSQQHNSGSGSVFNFSHPRKYLSLLVSLVLISLVSFLYLASVVVEVEKATTLLEEDNTVPEGLLLLSNHHRRNNTPPPKRQQRHRQPPDAALVIADLINTTDATTATGSTSSQKKVKGHAAASHWSTLPRIIAIPADTTTSTSTSNGTVVLHEFQYHRVQTPKEKIVRYRDYVAQRQIGNRTWEDFLDLPVLVGLESDRQNYALYSNTASGLYGNETSFVGESNHSDNDDAENGGDTCRPMANWMTASFVNCNSMHEIDLMGSVSQHDQSDLLLLGEGWFRSTWKYSTHVNTPMSTKFEGGSTVVVKTLRIEREFLEEYFELHRRDAVAMERLTFSPFVMDVYGYCGQSAINELAEGVLNGQVTSLEKLDRRMRGRETDPKTLDVKLQLATSISMGLAHIHNIHISDKSGLSMLYSFNQLLYGNHTAISTTGFGNSINTMAHYDINPRNIAIMSNGKPKLNDFNIAEFLTYNTTTNHSCGFRSRLHEPWWRAPEEMDLSNTATVTEKVDVYALGNVLFHILTTHSPRGKMQKERMEVTRQLVREGTPPTMLEPYNKEPMNKNPIVKAFLKALEKCFEPNPSKRGTAIQVARIFHKALKKREKKKE